MRAIRRIRVRGRVCRIEGLPFTRVEHVSGPVEQGTVVLSESLGRKHAWLGVVLRVKRTGGRVTHVWASNVWTRPCRAGGTWETRRGTPVSRETVVDAIRCHNERRGP